MPTNHNRLTSADVIEMNNSEEVFGIFNEAISSIPELQVISASPCTKTEYKTLVKTANPTVGFRASNVGVVQGAPTIEARSVILKFLDASWSLDQKVALESEWGSDAAITLCAQAALEAAMDKIAKQTWYGVQSDAQGFTGLSALLPNKNSPMVVDAGGTAANAASSIFAIRTELQGVQYAWGQNGNIDVGSITETEQWDADGKKFWAYSQKVQAYAGLQIPSLQTIGRICNITAEDGKGATEGLIAKLLEKFPAKRGPNALFMSARTLEQIRSKRVATTETGKEAPYPTEIFGIPIYVTDSIRNTEAILTAA